MEIRDYDERRNEGTGCVGQEGEQKMLWIQERQCLGERFSRVAPHTIRQRNQPVSERNQSTIDQSTRNKGDHSRNHQT